MARKRYDATVWRKLCHLLVVGGGSQRLDAVAFDVINVIGGSERTTVDFGHFGVNQNFLFVARKLITYYRFEFAVWHFVEV